MNKFFSGLLLLGLFGLPALASAQIPSASDFNTRIQNATRPLEAAERDLSTERATRPLQKLEESVDAARDQVGGEACKLIAAHSGKIFSQVKERSDRLDEWVKNRDERLSEARNRRDQALLENRQQHAARRAAMYAKLREKADTPEESAAVDAFEAAVEDAVGARQTAVDAVIEEFRAEVSSLSVTHSETVQGQRNSFIESVEKTVSEAQASCETAKNPGEVESALRKAVADARRALIAGQVQSEEAGDSVSDLAEERREAIDEINRDFRIKVQEAAIALKNAFQESSL